MLAMDKHSSLLQTIITYGRKKFYNIGSRPDLSGIKHSSLLQTFVDYSFRKIYNIETSGEKGTIKNFTQIVFTLK